VQLCGGINCKERNILLLLLLPTLLSISHRPDFHDDDDDVETSLVKLKKNVIGF
jgi:hypothetical protein